MLIVERQHKVLQTLRDKKAVQLEDISKQLGVSTSTVRRDLEALEQQGLARRTHGGAVLIDEPMTRHSEPALTSRMAEHVPQKLAIGAYAAAMVQPHMTIIVDGGSTPIYAARMIDARPIQIVTNSISIAHLFKDDDQVELLLLGGSLYPRTETTVGPIACGTLADLHADLLLYSLAGIQDDAGYNLNLEMASLEQLMMQQAAKSVMLMDSSKFGRKSLTRVCAIDEVDLIVTDAGIDPAWRDQLGNQLAVVEPAEA